MPAILGLRGHRLADVSGAPAPGAAGPRKAYRASVRPITTRWISFVPS